MAILQLEMPQSVGAGHPRCVEKACIRGQLRETEKLRAGEGGVADAGDGVADDDRGQLVPEKA